MFLPIKKGTEKTKISNIWHVGHLYIDGEDIPIAISKDTAEQWTESLIAGDKEGLDELVYYGKIFYVSSSTQVRVLDLTWVGLVQVRLLNGIHSGRTGWVPYEWVR